MGLPDLAAHQVSAERIMILKLQMWELRNCCQKSLEEPGATGGHEMNTGQGSPAGSSTGTLHRARGAGLSPRCCHSPGDTEGSEPGPGSSLKAVLCYLL